MKLASANNGNYITIPTSGSVIFNGTINPQGATGTSYFGLGGSYAATSIIHDTGGGVSYIQIDHTAGVGYGNWMMEFRHGGTELGNIITYAGGVSFNTASDYRLKTNPTLVTSSGTFIDSLQPKTWIWDPSHVGGQTGIVGTGFIAHELQQVSPNSVCGEKDGVNEDGTPKYQSADSSSPEIMANIIAELQSLRQRVAKLE